MFQTELQIDRQDSNNMPPDIDFPSGCKEMYSIKCIIFFVATTSMSSTFTEVALTQTKDSGESELSLFKVFLISAVFSILVSVIIALVVWQVRKPRLSSLSSSENACRWTNQSAYPGDVENNATSSRSYSSDFNVASFIPTKATEPDLIMHRESSASTTVYELGSTLYEDVEFIVGSVEKTIP